MGVFGGKDRLLRGLVGAVAPASQAAFSNAKDSGGTWPIQERGCIWWWGLMRAKNYATLTNTGRGCAVTAKTTSSLAMSVTVSLPERLKANLSRGKGSGALLFEDVAMRPTVMISDPLLDSDFGCEVLAFEFMEKEAYVTTQNGCLAYVWQ